MMTNTNKVILGLIGAATVGAVIGLLVAPEKGADLRKKVKNSAGDLASKLGDLFASGKEEFENLKSKAGREASSMKANAEGSINKAKESFS